MTQLRSDTSALKHQLSLFIQRIMPATPVTTRALVHALIDALESQHSHILISPEQAQDILFAWEKEWGMVFLLEEFLFTQI